MTSPNSVHKTGHSKPVHWDNPEEWDGEGGGRGVQDRGRTHVKKKGKKQHEPVLAVVIAVLVSLW